MIVRTPPDRHGVVRDVECLTPGSADDLRARFATWSDEQYGAWVERWYVRPFLVAGRVMSMIEGCCLRRYRQQGRREKREREGCCGEMYEDGTCPLGRCPVYERVRGIFRQIEGEK